MSKKYFLKGTLILTGAGLLTRFIGFFYRIFLSHSIGAQELGIYQLVMPLQMLVLSVTAFGIQSAISRLVSSCLAAGRSREGRDIFFTGMGASFLLSSLLSCFLYRNSLFFAAEILKEPRTEALIRILSFSIPLSSIHMCINSFYYAREKTVLPSAIQLFEQTVRVAATYMIYLIFLSEGREVTGLIAAAGSLVSEGAAALVSLMAAGFYFHSRRYSPLLPSAPFRTLKQIFSFALPLSVNRILITVLSSIEIVLIPQRLQMSGASPQEALSIYGVLTGMVMPLLFFPSTVTNSLSVMLMPSVSRLQALGQQKRILRMTGRTILFCLSLGGVCCLVFLLGGRFLGEFLFHSPTAGRYIQTLSFICPFLYLNHTLASVLNGLGRTGSTLIHSVCGVSIRIASVLLAIPVLGIRGYLYGLLSGELVLSILHLLALRRFRPAAGRPQDPSL